MGVCLYFTSTEAVNVETEWAVRSALKPFRDKQPWILCEPTDLLPFEIDGRLRGRTKLNLPPRPEELAEVLAIEVERNDLEELIHRLCSCSCRYSLTWELRVGDDCIGLIRDGLAEEGIIRAVGVMEKLAGLRPELAGET